jgi:hypothetical protein
MLVSAVTMQNGNGYYMSNAKPIVNSKKNTIKDTSFNSLSPFVSRKSLAQDKMPEMFDSINSWQLFCHERILGGKLNVIA